jgi:hypothetical protein
MERIGNTRIGEIKNVQKGILQATEGDMTSLKE